MPSIWTLDETSILLPSVYVRHGPIYYDPGAVMISQAFSRFTGAMNGIATEDGRGRVHVRERKGKRERRKNRNIREREITKWRKRNEEIYN